MNPTVVMLGAGGHAAVLREILLEQGIELRGYIAPRESSFGGLSWLGTDDALRDLDPGTVELVNGVGLARANPVRREVFERARALGFRFRSIIDATSVVKSSATLGEGVQVLAGAVVSSAVILGDNVIINTGAIVDHDCTIGAHTHIATGAALAGAVTIGPDTHIGLGARVIQGVTVGSVSTIGAGAVVLTDVADHAIAVGIPATSRSVV